MTSSFIEVRGASENNLQNVDADIPKGKLVVFTGPSGSGKSSLAFQTIYVEGQRRYLESLSSYARQFLQIHDKPSYESINGLCPTIAIDQKTTSKNPRSTVGTITEIYDYLRLLFARVGTLYSPTTGLAIKKQSISQIIDMIIAMPAKSKVNIFSPLVKYQKGEHSKVLLKIKKSGYARLKIDGFLYEIDDIPKLEKNKYHDIDVLIDRLEIDTEDRERISRSVESAVHLGEGNIFIEIIESTDQAVVKNNQIIKLSERFICPESGFSMSEIEPRSFSFNNPQSACPKCEGLGVEMELDINLIIPDQTKSLEGVINVVIHSRTFRDDFFLELKKIQKIYDFKLEDRWMDLPESVQKILAYGLSEEDKLSLKAKRQDLDFAGIIQVLKDMSSTYYFENPTSIKSEITCRTCCGYRLNSDILQVKISTCHIGQVCNLTILEAFEWFRTLPQNLLEHENLIAEKILKEISHRLEFLINVGLDYLLISRPASSLSGGENQRIRLASQIGCALSGIIYVLDEPSIGLHQSDNIRLVKTLKALRDLDNSVIVVEHDEETMMHADYIFDMGPGAGKHGGKITGQGTIQDLMQNPDSLTGSYLVGTRRVELPKKRRPLTDKKLILHGARANNLRNLTIEFPLGVLVCVTGVSGSGKSTLVFDTLQSIMRQKIERAKERPGPYEALEGIKYVDKVVEIDQSPIGRTPRSNPATYTQTFDLIRSWFAGLPESKAQGYGIGRFSFNVKGGRCESCGGDGVKKIEMNFLPDVFISCEECRGKRYNKETLEINFKGKNISDILKMSIEDACQFFSRIPAIYEKLATLVEVGLGYLELGQRANTLSGGESQRIKLAKELSRKSTGNTIYFLDEPTTGLHQDDIKNLLRTLNKLVDAGNSMIIIEHNLDVIKVADHVIDIGPGGGSRGGKLVVQGTPEQVAAHPDSLTGQFLKKALEKTLEFEKQYGPSREAT